MYLFIHQCLVRHFSSLIQRMGHRLPELREFEAAARPRNRREPENNLFVYRMSFKILEDLLTCAEDDLIVEWKNTHGERI